MDASYPAWTEIDPDSKAAVIETIYERGMSANDLAMAVNERFGYSVTRNAIIGLYSRHKDIHVRLPLGINNVHNANKTNDTKIRVRNKKSKPVRAPTKTPAVFKNILLEDLEKGQCRFPVNSGGPYLFCGCDKETLKSPYCDAHHAVSFYRLEDTRK